MISQKFMYLLDEQMLFHHTDYETREQALRLLRADWSRLQWLWKYDRSVVCDALFVLARRGYEILADMNNTTVDVFIERARELHKIKNAGYSGVENKDAWANFRVCEDFGISAADGCLTRLCDKYTRFFNVLNNSKNEQVGETVTDTLLDFAAYCLILICLIEGE